MSDEGSPQMRKMIRINELAERLGVHIATISRWVKRGQFPRPIGISNQTIAFFEDEVVAWQKQREAQAAPPVKELKPIRQRAGTIRPDDLQ